MRVSTCCQLGWLVYIVTMVPVASESATFFFEDYVEDDMAEFMPAVVTQHTEVHRRRRSVSEDVAEDDTGSFYHWYDFPEKMTFTLSTSVHDLQLDLTRNEYARSAVTITDEYGKVETDYESRIGIYNSEKQGASVLVECEMGECFLYGTVTIEGEQYHIEQDYSSANLAYHTLRVKNTPDMENMLKAMIGIPADNEQSGSQALVRRRRSVIPDCDIIEVKALLDNTIWNYYKNKYGGDEDRALDEIYKYFTSTFAEVDFRLGCLTDYFTHYDGTCDVDCLRVILVDIMITKNISWTDNHYYENTDFIRGNDGLTECGNINNALPGSDSDWDQLLCFTRRDMVFQEGGQWKSLFRTVAQTNSMCNSNKRKRVSVHEALGDGVDIQIAHALLYSLNGPKDKTQSCSQNGYFLMREPQSTKPDNPGFYGREWYLSDCTVGPICSYVNGLSTNCMRVHGSFNETIWKEWESVPLPGELFSTDQQCKVRWGNGSVQCDPTGNGDLFSYTMCSNYMYCTNNGSCVCKVRVSSGTPCSPCARICLKGECILLSDVPLGYDCECHSQCAGENSVCEPGPFDCGTCVCKDDYYEDNGTCVEKVPNDGNCSFDYQCLDENAICLNSTCQCDPCYYNDNGTCEKKSCLGGPCNATEHCKGDNVVCDPSRDVCVCEIGFYPNIGGECVPLPGDVCDLCITNPDSCTTPHTECGPGGFCICVNDTVEVDGACYGIRIGEPCTYIDTCVDDNAQCNGTVCVCDYGYVWNGTICVGCELCEPCDPSNNTCKPHLQCHPSRYRCECPDDEVQVVDDCYGTRINESCTLTLDTCIDDNAECDGSFCVCIAGFIWNGSICVGPDLCDPCDPNTPSCDSSLVCSYDTYRCECPPDEVQVADMCYGRLVTERCTTILDTCIDDNAECNGTICNCIPGFIWNGSICAGPDLCDPCDPYTPSCDSSLVCSSDTYRCECPPGQVEIMDACYGTRVTEPCTLLTDTCIDDNAICNGTICDCLPGFIWNGSICVGQDLCDPCDPNTPSCDSSLVCSSDTYRCECPPDQAQIGEFCSGTIVGEPCTTVLDICVDDNAVCNGSICDCMAGYIWNGSICVGQDLCDPCDPNTLACDSSLACSSDTYRCECPPDQVQIGDMCYGTLVGEPCTTSLDTCVDDNAECNGTICDCISGFVWNGSICVGPDLCDPCDPNFASCDSGLVCDSYTYSCGCPPTEVQIGDFCYGTRVTETCTTLIDTCIDDNAVCNGTICDCILGFIWNGSVCVGPDICDPCDPYTSSCDSSLICSQDSYTCQCPPDEVQIVDLCYGTRVTEPCTTALDTCVDDNAECNGTICDCIAGFTWNGSICVGMDLCDPCDPSSSTCASPLTCNPATDTCECPIPLVQIGDSCYGTRVTESCTTFLDTCIDDNAVCNGTICDCITGFTWNGTICVGPDLCDPCDPNTPSCDSSLVCSSDTYICECPPDQAQIGDACYGTRVTEPCTTLLDTCIDDNAECNGTICDCIPGFTWNGSICVGPDLCDPCDPNTPSCDSSLVCSSDTYTCECPSDQVQIGDFCYGRLVTEVCTTALDTCIDDFAECNGTVCDCITGFVWNGSICVGPDLCDPCDPNTPSCDSSLVCSSDTYRCECPSDQVQIVDFCSGTRVTEPCTTLLDTCIDDNAICNGTICDCISGFIWNGSICVGTDLCDPCDPTTLSCDSSLVCSSNTYRCECPPDQVQIGDSCYGTRVTEVCTTSLDTCIDDNAECNGTICGCMAGYIWNGSICVGTDLCDPCDPNTPSCDSSLVCSSDTYRCECPPDQGQIGEFCAGRFVTEPCTNLLDTCVDDNAECNGTVCDCVAGFTWNGSICLGSDLCDPCDPSNSTCVPELVCNPDTYLCECPPDEVLIDDACYGTRVTEVCTTVVDTCIDDNAVCNGTICDCIPGFVWNGSICVGPDLCDPCDPNTPSCDSSLVCSSDTYRCECPPDQAQIGEFCSGTRVTEVCTTVLDICIDDNAACNGTICDCLPGYFWNGSVCVGTDLCDPCDPSFPTCSSDLVCSSDTYRCECPPDQVQIGDFCAGTRVGEVCTTVLDTCIDDKAACNGTICDCLPGFTWNGLFCDGSGIDDPCSNGSCAGILVCNDNTSLCACPSYLVRIGDECYGTLIGEDCLPALDTCIDDNAMCNGTVCDCITGFTWNGSVCVGPDLCDPCDPNTPSCDSSLVCSSNTYRCECPPDRVQVGDSCYGTRVTEPCTTIPDTCIDDNAGCNGTICDCLPGFIWNGSICIGTDLCDPCDPSTPTCDSNLACSSLTYRCQCPSDEVQVAGFCVGTRVTEVCITLLDTCIDDNAACNGTICDCLPGYTWNGSVCVGTDLCDPCDPSTPTCDSDLVCSSDTYTCQCPPNEVQIVDTCYGTRVTETCTLVLDTCIDDNAACNGTICDCLPGFIWNGSICVGPDICDPCDPNTPSCDSSLVCSTDTYTCQCPPDQVQIGDACYGRLVTEVCTTALDTCVDDNAECNGTVCDCIPGFIWNGSICVGPDLCDPCDPNTASCDSSLVCSSDTYRCECPPGQVQIIDTCYGTRVTEPCTTSLDTCIDDNAVCNGTICDCLPGYIWNGSICVGSDLCDPCDPNTLLCDSSLVCSPDTYTCECPPGQGQIEDACYGTLVTEPCTSALDTCVDDNAGCNGTICDCLPGFIWNGSLCVGSDLCDPCDPSTPSCDSSLVCSPDTYRCECPPGQAQIGDFCSGTLVTEPCTLALDICVDDYAVCNGTICDCIAGFTWNGSICVGPDLCDPCDPSLPSCGSPLVCGSVTYRCECPHPLVQIGDMCYGTVIGDQCTTSLDTCVDDNAECNGTVCDCIAGFTWNGSICVGTDLCDPCDPSASTCSGSLVCSPDTYRCECPPGEVQIGDACYGRLVTESCTTVTDTCIDDYAECNGTVCDCIPGFTWNGSVCVGPDLCDPCDPNTPSCDSSLVCSSDTYRCECPPDTAQVGDICVGTRVTEPCTVVLDTCIDDNAACNGTICDCLPGFTWNGSICVGSDLCDPCDPNTPSCDSSLVCSSDTYQCECPPDQVQIGDMCYGTLVGEECTTSLDTCIDDNAECNGTICDCIAGFIWNGSICVGSDLCDPCDPSTASCDSSLVCSANTYRCECPPGEVQIIDACYGTRVTERCTPSLDTCIDDNAECNGTVCDCMAGYTWNGSVCVGQDLCDPCDPSNSTCASPLDCSSTTYTCQCPPGEVQIIDACYGTRVTEDCTTLLVTCIDDNAVCNGTICDCIPGFIWNGSVCVGPDLCDPCDPSTPSCDSSLVCSSNTYRCECPPDQVQIGDFCSGTLVGEPCTNVLDTCVDDNAMCNGSVCVCIVGFIWNGSICVGPDLWDPCDPNTPSCDSSLVCSSDTYTCECPSDQVQIIAMCYGTRVTELCTASLDTCIDDNAECNGTICDCMAGFVWNGSICVGADLCDPCDASTLTCNSPYVCSSSTSTCQCPSTLVQIDELCYGRLIGEDCTAVLDTCIDDNAVCPGAPGVCECLPPFVFNATLGICVGVSLDDPCDSDSCMAGLVCSSTSQKCECHTPPLQIDNVCYGSEVGDPCTAATDTCTDDNAMCTGGFCACIAGFTWNGVICVGTELDDPCDNSPASCASNGLVCGPTDRCECPDDQVQVDNTCVYLICGNCTVDSDCLGSNRSCVNGTCECDSGFYLDNCSICQPQFADHEPCEFDEQCLSGICVCGICEGSADDDCCDDCDEIRADIVFVTDNSGSVGSDNYQFELAFLIGLSNAFTVSLPDTRIGVVDYSTVINEANTFNMTAYTNNLDLTSAISGHSYTAGWTRTDLALVRATEFFQTSANRPDVLNFVIVITDGNTNNGGEGTPLTDAVNDLHAVTDMEVFSVGVGNGISLSELQLIATDNNNVFIATNFDTLDQITMALLDAICNGNG